MCFTIEMMGTASAVAIVLLPFASELYGRGCGRACGRACGRGYGLCHSGVTIVRVAKSKDMQGFEGSVCSQFQSISVNLVY